MQTVFSKVTSVGVMWKPPTREQVSKGDLGYGAPGIAWALADIADESKHVVLCVTCHGLSSEAAAERLAKWILLNAPEVERTTFDFTEGQRVSLATDFYGHGPENGAHGEGMVIFAGTRENDPFRPIVVRWDSAPESFNSYAETDLKLVPPADKPVDPSEDLMASGHADNVVLLGITRKGE